MTKIIFDEPSTANVNANQETALEVRATGMQGNGIIGESTNDNSGQGVIGISKADAGVFGQSTTGTGVLATSSEGNGLEAKGKAWGIMGQSTGSNSIGVQGTTTGEKGAGVLGQTTNPNAQAVGVKGFSENWFGVLGQSTRRDGVRGECKSTTGSGVAGVHTGGGIGVYGQGKIAGHFEGDVEVTGDIRLLNADCAEDFDISNSEIKSIEAGTVMVLTENGSLQSSYQEYDKKVAGIVSGAIGYKPGIILDRKQDQSQKEYRLPIALMGKVYCKVDARHSSIDVGDLLTTSSTTGYAMKAEDPMKAFGAVIGKALGSIKEGLGMIPILVALQ